PMATLRALLEGLGFGDVRTYLQSGNAVFTASGSEARVGDAVVAGITEELGITVGVCVRTAAEIAGVLAANPFPAAAREPKSVHVVFLGAPPPAERWARLDPGRFAPEEAAVVGREVYLHLPNGLGTSKLASAALRALPDGTARNWQTVNALAAMSAAD